MYVTKGDRVLAMARRLIAEGVNTFDAVQAAAREFAASDADEVALRNETHAVLDRPHPLAQIPRTLDSRMRAAVRGW